MKTLLAFMILFSVSVSAIAERGRLAYIIRFTDYEIGSEEDWLQGKGFKFEKDMRNRNRIDLEINNGGLTIEAKRRAFGFMVNETVNVPEFTHVEIDWGVNQFPEGASYEQGIRNEAIMVLIFMGDERLSSGSLFIPDSPYFIGLFICNGDDRVNYPYLGTYFKKSGRYVCGDSAEANEIVTTRFELLEAYRTYFDKERDDDPGISGLAIAVDTKKAQGGGKASAFIREIRFYH